jgi:sigma-B regulation protein RsbU (phosphoserine phosphatase)
MATDKYADARERLRDRRHRLETAISSYPGAGADLAGLLREVDAALERIEGGSYGLCESCDDPIEEDRLRLDPLLRRCIDHLTDQEKEALQQDLDLASRMQDAMLPERHLSKAGWEISYRYEPAGVLGGDYCDLVSSQTNEGEMFFLLGDVSGKGFGASMLMAGLRAIVRSLLATSSSVDRLMERTNQLFCESNIPSHFATLVCGCARPSGELEVCNAGHCPPILLRRGEPRDIAATGIPLGLFPRVKYATEKMRLEPGDTLVIYSDGLSEAANASDSEYGAERLGRLLRKMHRLSAVDLLDACLADLKAFQAQEPRADDLTLMAIKRAPV